ncbi:hypothetical protein E3N88_45287 [Mikania micrantha]|uniref:DUF3700 domain-containing protein n=1 Tax=Mikania micrantha TaxID=192012 RepID=A0A5N6L9J5_9ASTR|nr:hypothetical protein E3N88_45287 [Mikania micrantha]
MCKETKGTSRGEEVGDGEHTLAAGTGGGYAGDAAVLAYVKSDRQVLGHQTTLLAAIDGIYCLVIGRLNNLCAQIKQYGMSKNTNEAMFVIEAYRTLRHRGPYPADQVVNDLEGRFAFVVFDGKASTVFTALGSDGGVNMYWGIATDGSVVISDDLQSSR